VITDQQVTNSSGIQGWLAQSFTISDLSYVWIVCDVYEMISTRCTGASSLIFI